MNALWREKLAVLLNNLEAARKTLVCLKEMMERTKPLVLVDEYFQVLFALERVNEARGRLGKLLEKEDRRC